MSAKQLTIEFEESEIWLPIPGYEGLYSVSNLGRVRREAGSPRCPRARIIKGLPNRNGYLAVNLWRESVPARPNIHRLVTATFIGPCPAGLVVNHKNGIKGDNRLANLEYVTLSENMRHAGRLGLTMTPKRLAAYARQTGRKSALRSERAPKGESCHLSKLTAGDVKAIRERGAAGEYCSKIAADYNMTRGGIRAILKRWTWKHI